MRVTVPNSVLLALLQTSLPDGDRSILDEHALADFFQAVESSGYRTPSLSVFSDGSIECRGVPVEAAGKPAAVIRAIHQHGAITRNELSKVVWGDTYTAPENIRSCLARARNALVSHGLTIVNLPGDRVAIQKKS